MENEWTQNLHFQSNFDPEKPKKISSIGEQLHPLGYPNMSNSRLYLFSPFPEQYDYFLQYFGYFW